LVRKKGREDHGHFYALKVIHKHKLLKQKSEQFVITERETHEEVNNAPFFLRMQYALQTKANLYLVTGEYIKYICIVVKAM
jgi:hypothetical protein